MVEDNSIENLHDSQRIVLTFGQLLRLVREASSDDSVAKESGGSTPRSVEEERLTCIVDELLTNTLKNARRVKWVATSPKQIESGFIVCDVHKRQKPYDIVVQWVKDGELCTARIEDKSTEQSSMFEKTLRFSFKRQSSEISGIDFSEINSATEQSSKDLQNWKRMFSSVSPTVKRQLNQRIRYIISEYNRLLDSGRKAEGHQKQFSNDSSLFYTRIMDKVLGKMDWTLTEPFDFTVDMICEHFTGTHYLSIGGLFLRFDDSNPLELVDDNGYAPPKVEDIFKHAKATFQIKRRDSRYALVLHVYGLVYQKSGLSHYHTENNGGNRHYSAKENSMTLDELVHQPLN